MKKEYSIKQCVNHTWCTTSHKSSNTIEILFYNYRQATWTSSLQLKFKAHAYVLINIPVSRSAKVGNLPHFWVSFNTFIVK